MGLGHADNVHKLNCTPNWFPLSFVVRCGCLKIMERAYFLGGVPYFQTKLYVVGTRRIGGRGSHWGLSTNQHLFSMRLQGYFSSPMCIHIQWPISMQSSPEWHFRLSETIILLLFWNDATTWSVQGLASFFLIWQDHSSGSSASKCSKNSRGLTLPRLCLQAHMYMYCEPLECMQLCPWILCFTVMALDKNVFRLRQDLSSVWVLATLETSGQTLGQSNVKFLTWWITLWKGSPRLSAADFQALLPSAFTTLRPVMRSNKPEASTCANVSVTGRCPTAVTWGNWIKKNMVKVLCCHPIGSYKACNVKTDYKWRIATVCIRDTCGRGT